MSRVIVGVDPHKKSVAIEAVNQDGRVLATGRFGTDTAGHKVMVKYVREQWPHHVWAIEGAHGVGRPLRHISRGGGVPATGQMLPVAACRFSTASPAPRSSIHPPEAHLDETYRRFTHVHPSGLPLTYAPGWIKGRFGFCPEASHPAVTSDARPGGDGPSNTYPSYVIDATADLHSTRHLRMRPRVAPPTECLSCGWLETSQPQVSRTGQALPCFTRRAQPQRREIPRLGGHWQA
jgi:hypothetical protein